MKDRGALMMGSTLQTMAIVGKGLAHHQEVHTADQQEAFPVLGPLSDVVQHHTQEQGTPGSEDCSPKAPFLAVVGKGKIRMGFRQVEELSRYPCRKARRRNRRCQWR